jgi:hypothetical protein
MRDDAENNALDTLRRLAASLGSQASEARHQHAITVERGARSHR